MIGEGDAYRIFMGELEERRPLGGWIILKWILDKMRWYGLD
jgi:hypothetical protein